MSLICDVPFAMCQTIERLKDTGGFGFADLCLTQSEQEILKKFIINSAGSLDVFGLEDLSGRISLFLSSVGEGDTKTIADIIYRVALQVIQASKKETAHVIVRTFLPTDFNDIPRWHIDGLYYEGSSLKFAAALIGNPTLFYPINANERIYFQKITEDEELIWEEMFDKNDGKASDKFFEIMQDFQNKIHLALSRKPVHADSGQGVFFIVSDEKTGAVHSEPVIASPRLFFSVLPGTEKEIQEYQQSKKTLYLT